MSLLAGDNVIECIKRELEPFLGRTIKLKSSKGRNKVVETKGVLEQVYQKVFIVNVSESSDVVKRMSFMYADILTDTVKISICPIKEDILKTECAGF